MKRHIAEMQAAYGIEIAMFALLTKKKEHMDMAFEALGLK